MQTLTAMASKILAAAGTIAGNMGGTTTAEVQGLADFLAVVGSRPAIAAEALNICTATTKANVKGPAY